MVNNEITLTKKIVRQLPSLTSFQPDSLCKVQNMLRYVQYFVGLTVVKCFEFYNIIDYFSHEGIQLFL